MKAWSFIIFWVAINMAAIMLTQAKILPTGETFESSGNLMSMFNFQMIATIIASALGGGLLTLISYLGGYVQLSGALLIWAISILVTLLLNVFGGVNRMMDQVLANTGLGYISGIFAVFTTVIFFIAVFEIAAQRQMT